MSSAAALDTTIAVVTPENISFEYQLAGPFRRLPAYLIDFAVRAGLIMAVGLVLLLLGMVGRFVVPGAFLAAGMMLAYFLISWFYGSLMETYFNGRTVGKWACGLRVICTDGGPIDGTRAVIRNLLRIADLAPFAALTQIIEDAPPAFVIPTGLIGLTCMVCTRRLQRLGDLAAGTMVVIDEKSWRLPVTKVEDPRAAALATFIPGDYRVSRSMARTLATYVERRPYLTPARRREVARGLTARLVERFEFRPDIDPDLLMLALYHATFIADPRDPPPDLGPLAGHSPMLKDMHAAAPSSPAEAVASPSPLGAATRQPLPGSAVGAGPQHPAGTQPPHGYGGAFRDAAMPQPASAAPPVQSPQAAPPPHFDQPAPPQPAPPQPAPPQPAPPGNRPTSPPVPPPNGPAGSAPPPPAPRDMP